MCLLAVSCGKMSREGQGSSYLIVNSLEAASGAEPTKFSATMHSDVITNVKVQAGSSEASTNAYVPTVFSDVGRVRLVLGMKNVGGDGSPTTPTTNNFITIDRYRVEYTRADGRNVPGLDVPYAFDGAMTMTVGAAETAGTFEIVRHAAKEEAPLKALAYNGIIISTIADVTFYGHDQTGRAASVTARILIDFGDFGDPQ